MAPKDLKQKKDKDDVIVLDEKGKEEFDLGREDLDDTADDELDMNDDFDFDDGGD
jgi:hypothetical protein